MFCFPLLYNFQKEFSIILNCRLPLDGIIVIKKMRIIRDWKGGTPVHKTILIRTALCTYPPGIHASIPIFFFVKRIDMNFLFN